MADGPWMLEIPDGIRLRVQQAAIRPACGTELLVLPGPTGSIPVHPFAEVHRRPVPTYAKPIVPG